MLRALTMLLSDLCKITDIRKVNLNVIRFCSLFFLHTVVMTPSGGISYKEHQVQTPGSSGTNPKHGENMLYLAHINCMLGDCIKSVWPSPKRVA